MFLGTTNPDKSIPTIIPRRREFNLGRHPIFQTNRYASMSLCRGDTPWCLRLGIACTKATAVEEEHEGSARYRRPPRAIEETPKLISIPGWDEDLGLYHLAPSLPEHVVCACLEQGVPSLTHFVDLGGVMSTCESWLGSVFEHLSNTCQPRNIGHRIGSRSPYLLQLTIRLAQELPSCGVVEDRVRSHDPLYLAQKFLGIWSG